MAAAAGATTVDASTATPTTKRKHIVVLQPSYKDTTSVIKDLDVARNLTPWIPPEYEVEHVFVHRATVVPQIRDAHGDLYVNLCDGAWDEDSPGIEVVYALERFKKAFTGAPSRFYDPAKEAMKKVCYYWQINTPRYYFVYNDEDISYAARVLRFPLFVKHFHGYNSVGITDKSKVWNEAELRREASRLIATFGGSLVEEFVDGREFSVLICSNPDNDKEPITFRPVECVFDEGVNFKTFEYKWKGAKNPWVPVTDADLSHRLQEITKQMYLAMDGEGYARTDVRMGKDGQLYLLEINPNPSIFYPDDNGATADLILMMDGFGKSAFLQTIIRFALLRQRREERAFHVFLDPVKGLQTVAARNIDAGELIFQHEEENHRLVSKQHVEKNWNARYKRFFQDFCWPVSEDVWGMWDTDPEAWKPLGHSCDPNCWFDGLNMTARHAIRKGEEITMDYATLYADTNEGMKQTCPCSATAASKCRGGWTKDDYRQAWFRATYGDHVSDFVRQKQKQQFIVAAAAGGGGGSNGGVLALKDANARATSPQPNGSAVGSLTEPRH